MTVTEVRQMAAAGVAGRVACGAFERKVDVWQIEPARRLSSFETVLDFGGHRLALSDDGQILVAAAYHDHGVAAYRVETGEALWHRRDIKHAQRLSLSHHSAELYVASDDQPCLVLSLKTGATVAKLRGVRGITESRTGDIAFIDCSRPVVVEGRLRTRLFPVPRTTFAFLAVAFGPRQFVSTESAGAVRCFDVPSGRTAWTFAPSPGVHCLDLAYSSTRAAFVGVVWPYQHGGDSLLVAFDESGAASTVRRLGNAHATCFILDGAWLMTSEGRLVDVRSGTEKLLEGFC
jgi:hypothetical protein